MSGTRVTNISKNSSVYVTFGSIDSETPISPEIEPLSLDDVASGISPIKLPLTLLSPGKTLVYTHRPNLNSNRRISTTSPSTMKMYVWSVPSPNGGASSTVAPSSVLLWRGYVVTSIDKPIAIDAEKKTVTYGGTIIPPIDEGTIIERFQHYRERYDGSSGGTCMNGAGGMWPWLLGGLLIVIIIVACLLAPPS